MGEKMSEQPVRTLDDLLCFDLYAASRAVTALYRPMLTDLGLTYPQYLVLVSLRPDEPATVRQVAEALSLDHATLTPLLRRMESAGLLTRTRSGVDERRVEIALTAAGEALRTRFDAVQCAVGEAMGFTSKEFAQMQLWVRRMTDAVRRALDETAGVAAPS